MNNFNNNNNFYIQTPKNDKIKYIFKSQEIKKYKTKTNRINNNFKIKYLEVLSEINNYPYSNNNYKTINNNNYYKIYKNNNNMNELINKINLILNYK